MEKNIEQITAVNWWNSIDDIDAKSHLVKKYFYRTNCKVSVNEIVMLYRKAFPSPATLEGEQFTKGEWELDFTSINGILLWANGERDNGICLATIYTEAKEYEDDAHLIAASKDLYYALKQMVADYEEAGTSSQAEKNSHLLIAIAAMQKANQNYNP